MAKDADDPDALRDKLGLNDEDVSFDVSEAPNDDATNAALDEQIVRQDAKRDLTFRVARGDKDSISQFVERCKDDPGLPFEPATLAALVTLRNSNEANFARLWDGLRETRVGLANLKKSMSEAAKAPLPQPSQEERERQLKAEAERRQHEAEELREDLWTSCCKVAQSPTLLADMEGVVHALGVVGEDASIRGVYLAASSRLCTRGALCLLRKGAAAGGKNYLVSKTLGLIPSEAVVHMSSGSPLSLVYYGGGDENALAHKVLFVPEAAVLVDRYGGEDRFAYLLRTLISEGRLDHEVTVTQAQGPPVTIHIRHNGPVSVILTSARDNVEDEMLTRLVTSDADESDDQTFAVVANVLSNEPPPVDPDTIEQWLNFQRWLALDAPYSVVIPFRRAILTALESKLATFETLPLRVRRDVNALIIAIETSAILHRAQRELDDEGRLIATLADYAHAHDAFDAGLATLYQKQVPKTALAVVIAAEGMGATKDASVKITVSDLMKKLGITGRSLAGSRLNDATERGFLKLIEPERGLGKTSPRFYMLGKTSDEVRALMKPGALKSVFPRVKEVAAEYPPSVQQVQLVRTYLSADAGEGACTACTSCTTGAEAGASGSRGNDLRVTRL